jgi:hypothetical protein
VVSPEKSKAGISAAQVILSIVGLPSCLNRPSSARAVPDLFRPQLAHLVQFLFIWDDERGEDQALTPDLPSALIMGIN